MSYEERGQWVYLVVIVAAFGAYVGLVLSRAGGTPLAEVDYVPIMLWTIGLAIAASIIGRIGVEVIGRIGEEASGQPEGLTADVRDRDIDRFGEYVGGIVLGVGMVAPFVLAMVEADHFWIANAMYLVFALAAMVGTAVKLIAYRRGL
jgi:drug/metabolite transporter (DMT)-like permease